MRTIFLFLTTTLFQLNFCFGQYDPLSQSSCDSAKYHVLNNIREKNIYFIQFGLLDESKTYDHLLALNGISLKKQDSAIYDDVLYYSCYNNHIREYIDTVFGAHFLDSLNKLSEMIDNAGLGDRTPFPIGIRSLRSFLDLKVRNSNLEILDVTNKVIELKITIDKQGVIQNIRLISGYQILFEFIKDELSKLIWTNATKRGIPYDTEVSLTYYYKNPQ